MSQNNNRYHINGNVYPLYIPIYKDSLTNYIIIKPNVPVIINKNKN